jgi:hypothetical protein
MPTKVDLTGAWCTFYGTPLWRVGLKVKSPTVLLTPARSKLGHRLEMDLGGE